MINNSENLDKNLEKLNKILYAFDEERLTKEEFLNSFKNVIDLVVRIEKKNTQTIEEIKLLQAEVIREIKQKNSEILNSSVLGLKNKFAEKINNIFLNYQVNKKLSFILKEAEVSLNNLKNIKNGKDGKDADEKKIIQTILNQIKLPEAKEINEEIINEKINNQMSPIIDEFRKNWEDKVQDVLLRRGVGVGGGKISQIISETPSGALNGTNTTFTLSTNPKKNSLLLLLNGQGQRSGSDKEYTLAGKTITMNVAPLSTDTIYAYYTKF